MSMFDVIWLKMKIILFMPSFVCVDLVRFHSSLVEWHLFWCVMIYVRNRL